MSKPDLLIRWSKRERALLYDGCKSTGGLLAWLVESQRNLDNRNLAQELDARGYDLTTLRFSIRKKTTP